MVLFTSISSFLLPVLSLFSLSARALPHLRTASKKATLQLAVKFNSNGVKSIVDADRTRAKALLEGGGSSSISIADAVTQYTADIGVGSPPTYYTLLIDTGSSNTWIGASQAYVTTSTSQATGETFNIAYSGGSTASGEEFLDTVTINSDLSINQQFIGVVDPGHDAGLGKEGLDGMLGLGPVDLTKGTVSNTGKVPTVMDNLYAQNTINSEVLGVFFAPAEAAATPEITFGSYDASKITGDINYVPITATYPSKLYWGVDQSITYGAAPILGETAGIIDTGTTFILIASDAFHKYRKAIGATLDDNTGLLMISSEKYDNLLSLYFNIGGVSYELTHNAQIWPRLLNTVIGGTLDGIYLIISDIGNPSGSGLDFINGYSFLARFYLVFDTVGSQVGFATTEYTYSSTN